MFIPHNYIFFLIMKKKHCTKCNVKGIKISIDSVFVLLHVTPAPYRLHLPLTGYTCLLQVTPSSHRLHLPLTGYTFLSQATPASNRLHLPLTGYTYLSQVTPTPYLNASDLPIVHLGPVQPVVHWQEKEPALLIHVAPLAHGDCKHSFTSVIKNNTNLYD